MGYDLDRIRETVSLREVAEAAGVEWDRRKSNAARGDWWAPCPFHQEKSASFHVLDRDGFFKCFGCGAGGDLFRFVMDLRGVDFATAVKELAERGGVAAEETDAERDARRARRAAEAARRAREEAEAARRKLASSAELWRASIPGHPLLAAYLDARIGPRRRAAVWALCGGAPDQLRVHPALDHLVEDERDRWRRIHTGPAMVARVARDGAGVGVHRTWITPQGRARVGGVKLDKQMRGPCYGGVVEFTPPARRLVVGEGIETTLAYLGELASRPGFDEAEWSAVCALTLGGITGSEAQRERGATPGRLPDWERPGWVCPPHVEDLILLGDGSASNPDEIRRRMGLAQRRHACDPDGVVRRRVRIAWPPGAPENGADWADWAISTEGEAA